MKIQDAPLIRQNRKLKKVVDIPGIIWYHFGSCENNAQESRLSASPWHESVTRVHRSGEALMEFDRKGAAVCCVKVEVDRLPVRFIFLPPAEGAC